MTNPLLAAKDRPARQRARLMGILCLISASALAGFTALAATPGLGELAGGISEGGMPPGVPATRTQPQDILAWASKASYKDGRIKVRLRDSGHTRVDGARVTVVFDFPGRPELSRSFDLREDSRGIYSSAAPLPAKGLWTVRVTADRMDRHYESATIIDIQ